MRRGSVPSSGGGQFSVTEAFACWHVDDAAHLCAKLSSRGVHFRRSRFHEHFAYGGARDTHAINAGETHCRRAAGGLHIQIFGKDAERVRRGAPEEAGDGIIANVHFLERKSFGEGPVREERVGGGRFGAHRGPVGIEFVSGHLGKRSENTRSHVAMGDHDGNRSVAGDLDPTGNEAFTGPRRKLVSASKAAAWPKRIANDQGTGSGCATD